MFNFLNVAIFILGTTTRNGRDYQTYPTYLESRIIPIIVTWGQYFPYLFFVFGTNKYDYQFLKRNCKLIIEEVSNSSTFSIHNKKYSVSHNMNKRLLRARGPQIPSSDTIDKYLCPIYASDLYYLKKLNNVTSVQNNNITISNRNNRQSHLLKRMKHQQKDDLIVYEFTVLLTRNCTGEYFGYGPTCRCQEAMRYFNTAFLYKDPLVEWFMFMDDDVYIRPYSLVSMLENLKSAVTAGYTVNTDITTHNTLRQRGLSYDTSVSKDEPMRMALISSRETAGHFISHKAAAAVHCNDSTAYSLSRAQPCIINRAAMIYLTNAIDSNALTSLHQIWGGSHDSLLGMLLWIYAIPRYSFDSAYFKDILYVEEERITSSLASLNTSRHFIFHRVGSRIHYHWSIAEKKLLMSGTLAGYYDIAALLGDDKLYHYELYRILSKKSSTIEKGSLSQIRALQQLLLLLSLHIKATTNVINSSRIIHSSQSQSDSQSWQKRRGKLYEESMLVKTQHQLGRLGSKNLISLPQSNVQNTIFAIHARNIHNKYMNFTKKLCRLQ